MKIQLKHPVSNSLKEVKIGFSWTSLFFNFCVPLLRGDIKWFFLCILLDFVTLDIFWFIFPFIYNRLYIKKLLKKGYTCDDQNSKDILIKNGFVIQNYNISNGLTKDNNISVNNESINKIGVKGKNFVGSTSPDKMNSNTENEIRRMLDEWSKKRIDIQDGFGTGITIEKISSFSQYKSTLKLMKIKRTVTEDESPGRGYRESEGSINPFDYEYNLPEEYKNAEDKDYVMLPTVVTYKCPPETECQKCHGKGDCPDCNGRGEERCSKCGGRGVCTSCAGKGETRCGYCNGKGTSAGGSSCSNCGGRGLAKCSSCSGSGSCSKCKGSGVLKCWSCSGSGRCDKCGGKGSLICSRCKGLGAYQRYSVFHTKFITKTVNFFSNLVDIFDNKSLSSILGTNVFENDLFVYKNQEVKDDYIDKIKKFSDKNAEFINFNETDFLNKFGDLSEKETKIGKLKLLVEEFLTYKIEYGFEGKSYILYLVSDKNNNYYIFYKELPKRSGKEIFGKIIENLSFFLNPFINKNKYKNKVKFFTYLGILQMIADGKKDPKEIEILTNFINSSPVSQKIKNFLITEIDKEYTSEEIKKIIKKIFLPQKVKEEALLFVYTLSYQIIESDNQVTKSEIETLDSFVDLLGIDSLIKKKKLSIKNINEKAKTNARLLNNSMFDNYYKKSKVSAWIFKYFIEFAIYPFLIFMLISAINLNLSIILVSAMVILFFIFVFL